ncbi:MAG: exodeoxyribonuclease VII large subunit [Salinivirgaceae bacterium]|nr:exodeoxyribonuclease VII large subunit [Salinivirgaceae bacterium]
MTAPISLFELLNNVKTELKTAFQTPVWVVAEIIELNQNRMGHCYLELAEKDPDSDRMIAKTKATIWAGVYARLAPYFESVTGEQLRVGMKVLVRVTVEMHELYSFSLNVLDIDAQYTLGDIAQQRAKIIAQLTADGVIDMNKQLELPLVVQRIAVISSDSAAGWGDFKNQLDDNDYGYKFETELFTALMQGDGAPASIIAALNAIFNRIDDFDAVAILRGGGSKSDLSCFDNYELAYNAAQFPLPIITGIGHERDDSVLDLVANTRLKTPTALAAFIIDRAAAFEQQLTDMCHTVCNVVGRKIDSRISDMEHNSSRFVYAARNSISQRLERVKTFKTRLQGADRLYFDNHEVKLANIARQANLTSKMQIMAATNNAMHLQLRFEKAVGTYFESQQKRLEHFENVVDKYNPQTILARGYAIVTSGGKTVKSPADVKSGDELAIRTNGGVIEGVVK